MASSAPDRNPVLIAGAGPTGLIFALWLSHLDVPFRIVDKAPSVGTASRAVVMHARTLELYRALGLADDMIELGTRLEAACIMYGGVVQGILRVGEAGKGLSHFPYILSITQDEHEAALEKRLAEKDIHVERNVSVTAVDTSAGDDADPVVTLQAADGTRETLTASYVVGCDGAHSGVRHATGIKMEGGTYSRAFFVADVHYSGSLQVAARMSLCVSRHEFLIILPLPHREGRARLIGFVPENREDDENITFEDCRPFVTAAAPTISIDSVRWFARYKVHHRCAARFQHGHRVFLCGDAAHLHSPVGGQGMNTGLGDASNLAWKLAAAWHAGGPDHARRSNIHPIALSPAHAAALLATYEAERQPFARLLVHTTDRLFTMLIGKGPIGHLLRNYAVPYLVPFLVKYLDLVPMVFQRVSQTALAYPESPLSSAAGSSALPGMRLPWVDRAGGPAGEADNHSVLDAREWQAHVFGEREPQAVERRVERARMEEVLTGRGVRMMVFPWSKDAGDKGFVADAVCLVRPDGYIGLAIGPGEKDAGKSVEAYAERWGLGVLKSKS